ncbi:uncharacterized protein LOC110459751 [Mizuhopecten yessoensis]|uniref:uncharacterized protein LOC110459751 n=1 Tax=Mizuhopecten yessoensis TaxID=6573 RepID=UPI000B45A7DF|nr:uncharacterized protein LOC110459751 [Mizuhopecten yessoensis]XP_021367841.1 uncharacterized protein LOC110459751 [Mizuhopecten yessoensis]
MKGIFIFVCSTLISVTYGSNFCALGQAENATCENNGICTTAMCTTPQITAATTVATTTVTTTATPTTTKTRKRREVTTTAICKTSCTKKEVCLYQCTGQKSTPLKSGTGSIQLALSPLILMCGILAKLFLSV